MQIILKIYAAIWLADVILIALYNYMGKMQQRREIRRIVNDILNPKKEAA